MRSEFVKQGFRLTSKMLPFQFSGEQYSNSCAPGRVTREEFPLVSQRHPRSDTWPHLHLDWDSSSSSFGGKRKRILFGESRACRENKDKSKRRATSVSYREVIEDETTGNLEEQQTIADSDSRIGKQSPLSLDDCF